MTFKYKTKGFVFRKNNINEADRVFSIFTDDFGRLDIFAKAIRKINSKLRGSIDIFFMSDIEFVQGKSRKTLTDATIIEKFDGIYNNPEKFKIANKIGEVLDNFIKGEEKDQKLFDLLVDIFCKLDNQDLKINKYSLLYYYFLWSALSFLGYRPEVYKCNICQDKINPYNIYFSNKNGGVICKKCLAHGEQAQKINSDVIKILRLIFRKDWDTINKLKIETYSQKLMEDISENAAKVFCPA